MRAVAIVQARMGSARLPGKILADLAGEPMLARVVARVGRAAGLAEVIVATTDEPADDAVATLAALRGWRCVRGSRDDVLSRYIKAAETTIADAFVRITADCPLADPAVIDAHLAAFAAPPAVDYASNTLPPRSFPRGLDVEVIGSEALHAAGRDDDAPASREHVTPFIYRHPERFRLRPVRHADDLSAYRVTVDTSEDLALVREIYRHFGGRDDFSWLDAVAVLRARPEWVELNRHVAQREAAG